MDGVARYKKGELLRLPHFFLFFPDAVVDQDTLFGPFFLAASFLEILPATDFGRQAGYGRLLPLAFLRPHFLPVLTSRQSSANHLPKPPFLAMLATGTFWVTLTVSQCTPKSFQVSSHYAFLFTLLSAPFHLPPLDLYHLAAQAFA